MNKLKYVLARDVLKSMVVYDAKTPELMAALTNTDGAHIYLPNQALGEVIGAIELLNDDDKDIPIRRLRRLRRLREDMIFAIACGEHSIESGFIIAKCSRDGINIRTTDVNAVAHAKTLDAVLVTSDADTARVANAASVSVVDWVEVNSKKLAK